MAYLIDTNVLSEIRKGSRANDAVKRWQNGHVLSEFWVSVITLMEIRNGTERIRNTNSNFAKELDAWYSGTLLKEHAGRILDVNLPVCETRASFPNDRTLPELDALIAATAKYHGLSVATRNTKDFEGLGIEVINPWETPLN